MSNIDPLSSERTQINLARLEQLGRAIADRGEDLRNMQTAVETALHALPMASTAQTVFPRTSDHPPVKVGWGRLANGSAYTIWVSEAQKPVPDMDSQVTFSKSRVQLSQAPLLVRQFVIPRLDQLIAAITRAQEEFAGQLGIKVDDDDDA